MCAEWVPGYVRSGRGGETFLELDGAYLKQVFTILIWSHNRAKFSAPEREPRDKPVCVTGRIQLRSGRAHRSWDAQIRTVRCHLKLGSYLGVISIVIESTAGPP
jgi:hypothetical protein